MVSVGLSPSDPTMGAAYRYNGSNWQPSNLPMSPPELTSVWGPRATDLYATGGAGTILRYNGSSWQSLVSGTNEYLWSVSGAPSGDAGAFAVGFNSVIVRGTAAGSSGAADYHTAGAAVGASRAALRSFNPSARSERVIDRVIPDGDARKSRSNRILSRG
jgi:hypothetical protein